MKSRTMIIAVLGATLLAGCTTTERDRAAKGALIGGGVGAVSGAIIGRSVGGAVVGGVVGAGAGAAIGAATAPKHWCKGYTRSGRPIKYRC